MSLPKIYENMSYMDRSCDLIPELPGTSWDVLGLDMALCACSCVWLSCPWVELGPSPWGWRVGLIRGGSWKWPSPEILKYSLVWYKLDGVLTNTSELQSRDILIKKTVMCMRVNIVNIFMMTWKTLRYAAFPHHVKRSVWTMTMGNGHTHSKHILSSPLLS